MVAYYNEIDKFAAQWLRNLIAAGEIAPGTVDERDVQEVRPEDLEGFTRCHFFAGIAGWDAPLQLPGWPEDREVYTFSLPCQPFSAAGKRGKFKDERHLWPVMWRRFLLGLLAVAVVVIAVAALLLGILRSRKPAPAASLAPVAKSIAVLPFTDLSPDEGRGDLCEGISDAVINALSRIRGFRVTGRTSAAAVKYWKLDVREIGRRLDVMSVLDVSIQVEGDRLRINAQIISAEDGFVLWTKEIDGRLGDILDPGRDLDVHRREPQSHAAGHGGIRAPQKADGRRQCV